MPSVPDNGPYPWERKAGAMRIYLAARYEQHEEMRGVRDVLTALGHEVTSRWISGTEKADGTAFTPGELDSDYAASIARHDIEDVTRSDTLICFNDGTPGRGGRHVELGIAIALGRCGRVPMRIIICGPREHVFHALPEIEHYPDWPRLVMALTRESRQVAGPVTEEQEFFDAPHSGNLSEGL